MVGGSGGVGEWGRGRGQGQEAEGSVQCRKQEAGGRKQWAGGSGQEQGQCALVDKCGLCWLLLVAACEKVCLCRGVRWEWFLRIV
jgi:hypothetical protein